MSKNSDKVKVISQKVLGDIEKRKLSPTPETYEIFYLYYAQINADITRAIDMAESQNLPITDNFCDELYQKFLTNDQESSKVRNAGTKIQATIKNISSMVDDVKNVTHEYNENISKATKTLSGNPNPDVVSSVLKDIQSNTNDMMTRNLALEEKLQESVQVMNELQRNLDIVRKEALTDGLTGLSNRKAFDKEINRFIKCVEDGDIQNFSLVLMDIDHFKKFNDTYGHQVGDQVLKLVSRTMFNSLKGQDMAARYGGEEFAVLLPNTALQFAVRVSDNLRQAVESKEVVNRKTGKSLAKITISGGVSEYRKGEDAEAMIERADKGLYAAKNAGRNCIMVADDKHVKQKQA